MLDQVTSRIFLQMSQESDWRANMVKFLSLSICILAMIASLFHLYYSGNSNVTIPSLAISTGALLFHFINNQGHTQVAAIGLLLFEAVWSSYLGLVIAEKQLVFAALITLVAATFFMVRSWQMISLVILTFIGLGIAVEANQYYEWYVMETIDPAFNKITEFITMISIFIHLALCATIFRKTYDKMIAFHESNANHMKEQAFLNEIRCRRYALNLIETRAELDSPIRSIESALKALRAEMDLGFYNEALQRIVGGIQSAEYQLQTILQNIQTIEEQILNPDLKREGQKLELRSELIKCIEHYL
jgi:hypothetical protein